ncbi:MAG TPA: hypothetical protein VH143_04735 [Kofleriaceae bacterium]|nr:hypothetical protein [Kofleriaceae bacterium]
MGAIKDATGKQVVLYGGSMLRDLNITDHMGCQLLWVARYASTLPVDTYTSIGWTLDHVLGWQYCGDGAGSLSGYPMTSPTGKVDISTVLLGGANALATLRNTFAA